MQLLKFECLLVLQLHFRSAGAEFNYDSTTFQDSNGYYGTHRDSYSGTHYGWVVGSHGNHFGAGYSTGTTTYSESQSFSKPNTALIFVFVIIFGFCVIWLLYFAGMLTINSDGMMITLYSRSLAPCYDNASQVSHAYNGSRNTNKQWRHS